MPLDPPFDFTDPSQSWQSRGPLRITVRPYPRDRPPDNRLASDGIDDWIVPSKGAAADPYPDDWIVPSKAAAADPYPDDWIVPAPASSANSTRTPPNIQSAAAAINPLTTPVARSFAASPIPLQSFWSLMPASIVGATAWRPPIFLTANPTSAPDRPASAWPPPPPMSAATPFTQAQLARSASRDGDPNGLFPTDPSIAAVNGLIPYPLPPHPANGAVPAPQSLLQNLSNLAPATGSITPSDDSYPDDWIVPGQTPAADTLSNAFLRPPPSTSAVPVSYQAPARPWWNPPGAPGSAFDPWAEHFIKGIQGLLNFYSRSRRGGGDPDAPGCKEEWEKARKQCAEWLAQPYPPRGLTGGYRNIEDCARGHVSERCGGNPYAR